MRIIISFDMPQKRKTAKGKKKQNKPKKNKETKETNVNEENSSVSFLDEIKNSLEFDEETSFPKTFGFNDRVCRF